MINGVIMIIAWFKEFKELLAHFSTLRVSPTSTSFLLKASAVAIALEEISRLAGSWEQAKHELPANATEPQFKQITVISFTLLSTEFS